MKSSTLFFFVSIFFLLLFASCENSITNNDSLSIVFSDGTIINERNIEFYDSSTCSYFLRKTLNMNDLDYFKIQIRNDSLVGGKFHSCMLSSMPTTPYYISDCFFSGNDILKIGYWGEGENLLNSPSIIETLNKRGKLHKGLSCSIDQIDVDKSNGQTDVVATITITNHDPFPYLIPDKEKMGESYFTDYTGSLSFFNIVGGAHSFIKDNNSDKARDEIGLNDLDVIEGNSSKVYSYRSRNYHPILPGEYRVRLHFSGIIYTASNFNLNQKDGRIWVGKISANKNVIVEE